MGYINKLSCECGYEKQLNLGTGRQIPDVEFINAHLPAKMLTEFNVAFNIGILGKLFYIENTLSYCPKCMDIKEGKALHFQVNETEKIVYDTCPTCGGTLQLIKAEPKCPKCSKPLLESTEGLWD